MLQEYTESLACSPILVDTIMVFLKEFFEKVDFEKNSTDDKKNMQNYPAGKVLNMHV